MNSLIEIDRLVKIFPPNVTALDDVSVDFREGEIHALVGENGAGKSTLMKILYGMYSADGGAVRYRGEPVRFAEPGDAIRAGIGMVHQEILRSLFDATQTLINKAAHDIYEIRVVS